MRPSPGSTRIRPGSSKHEFAWISTAAVHIDTSTSYLWSKLVNRNPDSYSCLCGRYLTQKSWLCDELDLRTYEVRG